MLETFLGWDLALFHFINSTATHPAADWFFANTTNLHREAWMKFAFLPLVLLVVIWRTGKRGMKAVLVLAIVIGACDLLNHRVIKPAIGRDRPFKADVVAGKAVNAQLRLPVAPGGYSFPSNHAMNIAAGATVVSAYFPAFTPFAVVIAFLIGYSRPYLGVHYPSDIMVGWIEGFAVACLILFLLRRFAPTWAPAKKEK